MSSYIRSVADPGGAPPPPPFQKIIKNENLFLYNVVKKMCFVNIYVQYSLAKYGFWSTLEVI